MSRFYYRGCLGFSVFRVLTSYNEMMKLVPDHIEALASYNPGPGPDELRKKYGVREVAELANNENPLGPSPLAVRAMQRHLEQSHRYSTGGLDLRRALADRFRGHPARDTARFPL